MTPLTYGGTLVALALCLAVAGWCLATAFGVFYGVVVRGNGGPTHLAVGQGLAVLGAVLLACAYALLPWREVLAVAAAGRVL